MNRWQALMVALALGLSLALLIVVQPPTNTIAAPADALQTPYFLPAVLKDAPITSTVPITVGPVSGVEMFVFSPMTVTIHAGDAVHWVWGSTGHTVTSGTALTPDNQFCSPNNTNCDTVVTTSSAGDTFDHQFLAPGTYNYFCQIHGAFGMTGTVFVLP